MFLFAYLAYTKVSTNIRRLSNYTEKERNRKGGNAYIKRLQSTERSSRVKEEEENVGTGTWKLLFEQHLNSYSD